MFQESCHVRAVVGGPENDESAGSNHLGDEQIRGRQCRGPQRRTPGGAQRRDGSRACSSPAGESPNWVPTLSVGAHSNLPDSSTLRRIHASRLREAGNWQFPQRAWSSAEWRRIPEKPSFSPRFSVAEMMGHGTLCVTPACDLAQSIVPDAMYLQGPRIAAAAQRKVLL